VSEGRDPADIRPNPFAIPTARRRVREDEETYLGDDDIDLLDRKLDIFEFTL